MSADTLYKSLARNSTPTTRSLIEREREWSRCRQAPHTVARWKEIVAESEKAFGAIYDRLSVLLTPDDYVGERSTTTSWPIR
ncbi:hypothetical protein ACIGO9_36570 [Nocardia asteroides]|uniref:hypothetical protein n=1 Tax=Nocardia asteroides TaxID=1824 RepID=UPI0037C91337